MNIKIGNRTINVRMYCYSRCGDTENLAYVIDNTYGYDYNEVINKISDILSDELDKEYDNENNRCK